MKNKKIVALLITSSVAIGACASLILLKNKNTIINYASSYDYSLTLNSSNKLTTSSSYGSGNATAKTDQNKSDYEFSYSNIKNYSSGFATFKSYGYVGNVTPFKGLYSVTVNTDDDVTLYYSSSEITDTSASGVTEVD